MAELATSLLVAPVVSLLKKKVVSLLTDQYKVMEGMEKNYDTLKLRLEAIEAVIADAEKQGPRRGVREWLEQVKTAAYKAHEVFDDFEYEVLRRRAKENGHITELGIMARVKLFPTHNRAAFRCRVGYRLQEIVDTFKKLTEEMNTYRFNKLEPKATAASLELREMDFLIDDHENIVTRSRNDERKKIVNILVNGRVTGGDLMVVPIVGMGGLGKTTLAQLIYNDPQVKEHFQLLKWVCVSDDFSVLNLANKICNASETDLEEAMKNLQKHLNGKRYLLVLDDVWEKDINFDKWRKIKACLTQGVYGAILATTREKPVAEFMGTVVDSSWTNRYHEVAILGKEYIQEIILTRAFRLQKSKPDDLVELVDQVVERCVGSPMAAKAIGSVLCTKTTKEEWEGVLQPSTICNDETGIMPILKLSYNDLPTYMKQCFAFCAMYPKDYQIDMDNLIQLWMANGFISGEQNVPAETMGKRIVNELVSRSFFQYEEQNKIEYNSTTFLNIYGLMHDVSRTFLKIHDLMHDVALSVSRKECIYITEEFIKSGELLPSAARHILFERWIYGRELDYLFASMRKMSRSIQTLMFDRPSGDVVVQHLSRYSSLRVLSVAQSWGDLLVKPKHHCHLRFLDITNSTIEELPEDISILYNLQTLKLSNCDNLIRLPEQMKHMSALRHLYTDGCMSLECMPPELGRITSLRTITWFVVGSGLSCSSLDELKDLNIGGSLMLKKLENVHAGRRSATTANLVNKKDLRQLSLEWTSGEVEEQQCHEVLEGLEAHDGLLSLGIDRYQGTSFPSWMGTLKNVRELRLYNCSKVEQLPPLCQLPELQLLFLMGLGNLRFLCSRCTSTTFGKLKDLELYGLHVLEGFCETVHGGAVAFPRLEKLQIVGCENLAALPEASSVLGEAYCGEDYTVARSAFPELKSLLLENLRSFERWEAALEIEEEGHALFPLVETMNIRRCPKLTTLPKAPKVKDLRIHEANEHLSLGGIRCMTSLSSLYLCGIKLEVGEERLDRPSSMVDMTLRRCSLFFQPRALALWWVCYGQLQDLEIARCDDLVYWPEKAFQSLISLRRLQIDNCSNLIGYAATTANGPDQATSGRNQLLPHLESLQIERCESLVEVFNSSPALKSMEVRGCPKLESISLHRKQQLDEEASSTDDVMASAPVEEMLPPSAAALDKLLPSSLESLAIWDCHRLSSLESLTIRSCDGLSEVVNLPSSLKEINIYDCSKLRFMSGQLDALNLLSITNCLELRSLETCFIELSSLEYLTLRGCKSLTSLPSARAGGPQEYSSLRKLTIRECPGIKSLPSALQQRLDSGLVDTTFLDSRYREDRSPRLLGRLCSWL